MDFLNKRQFGFLNSRQGGRLALMLAITLLGLDSVHAQVTSGKVYRIISTCGTGNKVMAIQDDGTQDYAPAVIATRVENSRAQMFKIESVGTYYKITAMHSGKVLDVIGNSLADNASVIQYTYKNSPNQHFRIRVPATGIYEFQNVNSRRYIDLAGANTTDGNKFVQYQRNGTCAQRFKLQEVSVVTPLPTPVATPVPTPVPTPAPTATPAPAPAPVSSTGLNLRQLIDDMTLPHEATGHGINPYWDWGSRPRMGVGVNFPTSFEDPHFTPWGIAASAESGSPARNARVQIRKLILDIKRNGVWSRVSFSSGNGGIMGALYTNYETNATAPANTRDHGVDGISVKIPDGGGSFHFMSKDRYQVARGAQEIIVKLEARLIVDNTSAADDRANARLLVLSGGDIWRSRTAAWNPQTLSNVDFAIGRLKFVTNEWKTFTSHTFTTDAEANDYLANEPRLSPR